MTGIIYSQLRHLLTNAFSPKVLILQNDSHKHHGHDGSPKENDPGAGESHFTIRIQSDVFNNRSRLKIHREIMQVCKPLFQQGLHALSLEIIRE